MWNLGIYDAINSKFFKLNTKTLLKEENEQVSVVTSSIEEV